MVSQSAGTHRKALGKKLKQGFRDMDYARESSYFSNLRYNLPARGGPAIDVMAMKKN